VIRCVRPSADLCLCRVRVKHFPYNLIRTCAICLSLIILAGAMAVAKFYLPLCSPRTPSIASRPNQYTPVRRPTLPNLEPPPPLPYETGPVGSSSRAPGDPTELHPVLFSTPWVPVRESLQFRSIGSLRAAFPCTCISRPGATGRPLEGTRMTKCPACSLRAELRASPRRTWQSMAGHVKLWRPLPIKPRLADPLRLYFRRPPVRAVLYSF
jgi:hypothetical protein